MKVVFRLFFLMAALIPLSSSALDLGVGYQYYLSPGSSVFQIKPTTEAVKIYNRNAASLWGKSYPDSVSLVTTQPTSCQIPHSRVATSITFPVLNISPAINSSIDDEGNYMDHSGSRDELHAYTVPSTTIQIADNYTYEGQEFTATCKYPFPVKSRFLINFTCATPPNPTIVKTSGVTVTSWDTIPIVRNASCRREYISAGGAIVKEQTLFVPGKNYSAYSSNGGTYTASATATAVTATDPLVKVGPTVIISGCTSVAPTKITGSCLFCQKNDAPSTYVEPIYTTNLAVGGLECPSGSTPITQTPTIATGQQSTDVVRGWNQYNSATCTITSKRRYYVDC